MTAAPADHKDALVFFSIRGTHDAKDLKHRLLTCIAIEQILHDLAVEPPMVFEPVVLAVVIAIGQVKHVVDVNATVILQHLLPTAVFKRKPAAFLVRPRCAHVFCIIPERNESHLWFYLCRETFDGRLLSVT